MTSSQHGPYAQGDTRATMASTEGSKIVRWSKSLKLAPVRIVLQLDYMKSELLVMACQP